MLLLCFLGVLNFYSGISPSYAQQNPKQKITVKGFVVEHETYADLRGVHVYSTSGYGAITNKKGFFQIKVYPQDTLYFSRLEYEKKSLIVTDTSQLNDILVSMKRKTYMLDSVEVRAGYMPDKYLIQEEREPMYIEGITRKVNPEKEYQLGVGGAVTSPATALYRAFSKKYKAEKKVHKLEKAKSRREDLEEKAYERLDDYMNIYDARLNYDDYDKLVDRCNMGLQRILNSNDYDLYLWIDDCVKEYIAERDKGY